MKSFLNLFVFILFIVPISSQCETFLNESSAVYFKKCLRFSEKNRSDSALYYLQKSFSSGLSDDSLYYLWSEIYLHKRTLDTALALNFASVPKYKSKLHRMVLEQRYLIYSFLGWEKEAKLTADSLGKFLFNRVMKIIPDAVISMGSGFISEREIMKEIPFEKPIEIGISKNLLALLSTDLKWKIPFNSSQGLRVETRFGLTGSHLKYPNFSLSDLNDSMDTKFSAGLRYYVFDEQISAGYNWSRECDLYGNVYFVNRFDLRHIKILKSWSVFLECGYELETEEKTRRYSGLFFLNRSFSGENAVNFSLDISGYQAKELIMLDNNDYYVKYVDGFTFYTDSSFIDTIRPPFSRYDFMRGNTLVSSYLKLPRSYLGLAPSFSLRFGIWRNMILGIGGGYNLIKYIGDYSWLDFGYSRELMQNEFVFQDPYVIIAVNKQDRQKYLIRDIDYLNREMILDTVPVTIRREKRVDNSINVNFYLTKEIGKLGDVSLRGDLSRNFSNMMDDTPEEIPEFSFRFLLSVRIFLNSPGFSKW